MCDISIQGKILLDCYFYLKIGVGLTGIHLKENYVDLQIIFSYFCYAGDSTQGLVHAGQMLHH